MMFVERNVRKMSFLYLFIGVFLHRILPALCANKINCPLRDVYTINESGNTIQMSYNGFVSVSYDRDNLAIYRYQTSQFVNFLLNDAKITFNGTFSKDHKKNFDIRSTLDTNIEGLALRKQASKNNYVLRHCKLDLKKNTKFSPSWPLSVQEQVVEVAHACIQTQLCSQLGIIDIDDYIRAKIEPHDFDQNSITYITLKEKYPNLEFPVSSNNESNLQATLNVLADFWLASLVSHMSGKQLGFIDLPDVNEKVPGIPIIKEGTFKLSNGTFGNLTNIRRSQDIKITNSAFKFAVEGGFELDNATIHFDKYCMKFGISSSGKIDIKIDRVKFDVKIAMNYNDSPCKTSLIYLSPKIGEISFKLSDGSVFDGMLSGIVNTLIRQYTNFIFNFIETKMNESISAPLNQFDCEKYRP